MSNRIATYTGKLFDPFHPESCNIDILDIAHALSQICRFNGHVTQHYSVAQHSVHVSDMCPPEHALAGLLHDASEAYLADIPSPLKRHPAFGEYRRYEENLTEIILRKFGVSPELPKCVHDADRRIVVSEARLLMRDSSWCEPAMEVPVITSVWTAREAERNFLRSFIRLSGMEFAA